MAGDMKATSDNRIVIIGRKRRRREICRAPPINLRDQGQDHAAEIRNALNGPSIMRMPSPAVVRRPGTKHCSLAAGRPGGNYLENGLHRPTRVVGGQT
ncbi:unnamed protein product [Soboliphyme baturini]|uniref:Uncharacterized protein n=1 Tax=Soboliphyme baturini TaxID=241478 RepID=A0A183IHV2_9BILA|nr:unnamed protein product [Soboliphyme baturini]